MLRLYGKNFFDGTLKRKNWEDSISKVCVEACDCTEDPLGYKAVFFTGDDEGLEPLDAASFVVGASFLVQRQKNLSDSGYVAPMTDKAIALIESELGRNLGAMMA